MECHSICILRLIANRREDRWLCCSKWLLAEWKNRRILGLNLSLSPNSVYMLQCVLYLLGDDSWLAVYVGIAICEKEKLVIVVERVLKRLWHSMRLGQTPIIWFGACKGGFKGRGFSYWYEAIRFHVRCADQGTNKLCRICDTLVTPLLCSTNIWESALGIWANKNGWSKVNGVF